MLFLPVYSFVWASSRYRAYLWAEALAREGFRPRVLDPPTSGSSRLAYYAALLVLARRVDVIFIQKKLFPVAVLRLLRRLNPRLVFDFDDAFFARPPDLPDAVFARQAPGHARLFHEALRSARLVIAGNEYLAEYARRWNRGVTVIPTAIDLERLPPVPPRRRPTERAVVGWTGRSATLPSLDLLRGALPALRARVGDRFVLRVVSDGVDQRPFQIPGVAVENVVWTLGAEYCVIDGFDVGVMPLPDDPWHRGKCGFKLLQYMSRAVPVVASPVGVNRDIVQDGVNGFHAASGAEWTDKLATLIEDPGLGARLWKAGAETVAASYSFRAVIPRLTALLAEVAGGRV